MDETTRARAKRASAQLEQALADAWAAGAPRDLLERLTIAQGWMQTLLADPPDAEPWKWLALAEAALRAWQRFLDQRK